MQKIIRKIKEKLRKKSFWLTESNARKIENAVKKSGWKSESVLMNHIINSWFAK